MQEVAAKLDAGEPGHEAVSRLVREHEDIIGQLVQLRKAIEALATVDADEEKEDR